MSCQRPALAEPSPRRVCSQDGFLCGKHGGWPSHLSSAPGCLGDFFCQRAIFANRGPTFPFSVFSAVVGALRGAARALGFSTCGVSGALLGGGPRRRRLAGVTGAGGGVAACAQWRGPWCSPSPPAASPPRCSGSAPGSAAWPASPEQEEEGRLLVRNGGGLDADHQGRLHRRGGLAKPPVLREVHLV